MAFPSGGRSGSIGRKRREYKTLPDRASAVQGRPRCDARNFHRCRQIRVPTVGPVPGRTVNFPSGPCADAASGAANARAGDFVSAASRLLVGGPVSTQGPSSVMAMVCSKWALGLPSCVDWVQWSGIALDLLRPHVDHRLDRDHQARLEAKVAVPPQLRADEIGHLRVFVHFAADAVADEALDDRKASVADVGAHFAGHFAPAAFSLPISSIARSSTPLVTSSSRCTSGAIWPTAMRDGRVAAPAGQLAAGVDADDVALFRALAGRECRAPLLR